MLPALNAEKYGVLNLIEEAGRSARAPFQRLFHHRQNHARGVGGIGADIFRVLVARSF